jgi:CheY-like chemotaxis protein
MGKKRILLVDDEKSFTNLLKLNLEDTGNYEVRVENWAEDALPAAQQFKPDLVLLDIIMPRLPGGNVAAQIKEDPALKDTPIVRAQRYADRVPYRCRAEAPGRRERRHYLRFPLPRQTRHRGNGD